MRVALLVTHLMGSGHLQRMLAVARALARAGARPTVISGGRPLAHLDAGGVELIQLPPVSADGLDYKTLLGPDGRPADAALMAARRAAIARALSAPPPDALVVELYPFGRRQLAEEFEAAIAAMAPGAPVFCSIRDVLEPPRKPARVAWTMARLAPFRAILAHGDPALTPLSLSWPEADALAGRLIHTGYVAEPPPPAEPDGPGAGEALVSVGGGAIGRRLLEMAALAARGSALRWRLLVGGADAAAEAARLAALGPALAEPARPDYRRMLGRAAVSVSLCGYNTAVEAALSPTPALLVPMEEGGEREQLIRARAFAGLEGIEVLRIGDLTPERLARAAEAAAARPRRPARLAADGAARAAEAILAACAGGRAQE
ncbi:glycosyltransferase [Oceanicella actignis]|uniref:Predicted glycosyl transferase n=1 Tax=Oceanicella actignis TaxID=1189325 RepID=A0A1M7TNF2_9RHOB|nr:glycosyltransferase [Oceanicella actignis]SET72629.1 Predicted glycosyl transferase [Oceanicella actignis]SHN72281.1 Predicted glycosyl transferase [Oceanicella actignis]